MESFNHQTKNDNSEKIKDILKNKTPKTDSAILIGVDGHGGSGKSTLAKLLSKEFGAEIIHTDDFASWDNPLDWWPLLIEHVFKPIQNGAPVLNYPRSKWWENHNPEPVVNQLVTKIMILEGVSALRREFRKYIDVGIFVDAPKSVCLQRGVIHDADTGKSKEELTKMWNEWFRKEERYFKRDNPRDYADIVVDGTEPFEYQI